jgi:serine/threonine-protein kinase
MPLTDPTDFTTRLQAALGGAYRLERELGGGGMSRVFLAVEASLGRRVVIKVLPPEMAAAVQTERFQREIQVAASLQHPHIVPLLTAGAAGDLLYYVMPFIEGESLGDRLAREGALPVPEAARILREVVDGLAHAHARGVVHRDIKPGNVMLSGRHAMVTDFGVAKAVSASSAAGSSLTSLGVALGTPAYMAPEQAAADPATDHRADIYAVGVVAYEMLAGRKPYEAPTPQAMLAAHITGSPDPVSRYRASIPPALAATVMRCLEKHPADRWQSAADLGQALEAAVTPSGGTTPVSTAPYPAAGGTAEAAPRRGGPARVALLFGLATAAVVGVVFGLTRILGLPDWVWVGALLVMLAGLPVMLYTSRVERRRAAAATQGTLRFEPEPAHHGWFTWRRAFLGGGLAIGGLVLAVGAYAGARSLGIGPGRTLVSDGLLGGGDRLVLADFANRTSDSTLGPSITEALRVDLGQSKVVRLLASREIASARSLMQVAPDAPTTEALAMELARREGAKAVIAGEVAPLGGGFVLTARVIETASGEDRVALRETAGEASELLPALDRLSARLRERIGESLKAIRASAPLERVATPSLEALRLYSAGTRVFDVGDYDGALPLLEQAIARDSLFGMAWRKLSVTLNNLGRDRSRSLAAARRAYELRDRLPPIERHLAEANYFSSVERDLDRAIAAYRAVLDFDPDEMAAINNLGLILNRSERFAEAERVLRAALRTHNRRTLYDNLVDAQMAQSRWQAAESTVAEGEARLPASAGYFTILRSRVALAARDYSRAESLIAAVPDSLLNSSERRLHYFDGVDMRVATGRHSEALRMLDEAARQAHAAGDRPQALDLALVRSLASVVFTRDTAAAERALEQALSRYPPAEIPERDRPWESLANIHALLGHPEMVRRQRAGWEASRPVEERRPGSRESWDGLEARARGDLPALRRALEAERSVNGCSRCGLYALARVLDDLGETDSALVVYERAVSSAPWGDWIEDITFAAPTWRRLGQLHETRGDREKALDYYRKFVEAWRVADPGLQPGVAEAKARMAALAGEPR